ncbi:MAG: MoaD/ThiS family protein [Chloroflexi bacterium]|nr:MoaD family protein [Chloroflexota bacterium]MDA1240334.1 MoaD family protein [Chloroflexota bacterium]MQC19097.1 MoaD/ThiS family protein [Chloroflexota bacterium]
MAVTVHVTSVIQQAVNGQREFSSDGKTVGELIGNIEREYPGFATRIMDEHGALHRFVNIYLNDEDVRYLGGKDTPLSDGDSVSFLPALAGGI